MNYLLSAYSVNPYKGSEDGVGWNWAVQLDKHCKDGDKVFLLTKRFNEEDTKKGIKEFDLQHVELVIVDVPNCLNWFREKYSVFHHMYYILWQHFAYKWVKKAKIKFDLIHHVTMGDFRITGEMYKIKDAYTIWGPVGGAQITPESLKKYEHKCFSSAIRELINKYVSASLIYKNKLKRYSMIIASNMETYSVLKKVNHRNLVKIPEIATNNSMINIQKKKDNNEIKLIFVGRLIEKKGVEFLIDSIKLLPKNINYKLEIYGDGKDKIKIQNKIEQYSLEDKIVLMGNVDYLLMKQNYENADIFLMSSLRETGGTVLIEAMEHALPIVAFDTSFAHELALKQVGLFVNVKQSLEKIQKDYMENILKLINDSEMRRNLGNNGQKYVYKELTWDKKYIDIYEKIDWRVNGKQ